MGFLHIDGNGCDDARTDVAVFVVLAIELLDGAGNMLFEGTLMGTALNGVLAIHKGVVFLAILLVGVREGNFDVVAFQVDNLIQGCGIHRVLQEVFQTIAAHDATAIVVYLQTCVQVGVVAQHVADKLVLELVVEEERVVGCERDECAILF